MYCISIKCEHGTDRHQHRDAPASMLEIQFCPTYSRCNPPFLLCIVQLFGLLHICCRPVTHLVHCQHRPSFFCRFIMPRSSDYSMSKFPTAGRPVFSPHLSIGPLQLTVKDTCAAKYGENCGAYTYTYRDKQY